MSPGTSSVVQAAGATRAGTFDVNCACAGWVTAPNTAAHTMISDSDYRYVLVAGGCGMSRFLDWKDKHTATLFADGAGAVILGRSEPASGPAGAGFLAGKLLAHGQYHDALGIYGGGTCAPAPPRTSKVRPTHVRFVKKFPAPSTPITGRLLSIRRWPRLAWDGAMSICTSSLSLTCAPSRR